jgi:hypothetical protein
MWEAAGKIGSGLALVAFIVAAVVTILRQRLLSRERQLLATSKKDRPQLVQILNDSFLIPSLPIDPEKLTPEQKYNLLLEQIRDRSKRFYTVSIVIIAVALSITVVSVFAMLRAPNEAGPTANRPAESPSSSPAEPPSPVPTPSVQVATKPAAEEKKPPEVHQTEPKTTQAAPREEFFEKEYRFDGPFRIARLENAISFNLSEALKDLDLSNRKIRLERISFTAPILNESEAFGYDNEILFFSQPLDALQAKIDATDFTQLLVLRETYIPPRRRIQLTVNTDSGRAVNSQDPLTWSVDLIGGTTSSGDLKFFRDSPLDIGSDGMSVQLLLWTLWGGEHFVQLDSVTLKVKGRILN